MASFYILYNNVLTKVSQNDYKLGKTLRKLVVIIFRGLFKILRSLALINTNVSAEKSAV